MFDFNGGYSFPYKTTHTYCVSSLTFVFKKAGPMTRHPNEFTKYLRQYVVKRLNSNTAMKQQPKSPRIYPSLSQAIYTRMETAKKFPGQQYISEVAATELVIRGTKRVTPTENGNRSDNTTITTTTNSTTTTTTTTIIDGYQFRHDPRLQWPSIQYCTNEQLESIYANIHCSVVLLLLAQDGWPIVQSSSDDNDSYNNTTQQQVRMKLLLQPTPLIIQTLPGSHHFHADPDTAEAVVVEVAKILV
jgi:hypothetical protein